MKRIFISPSKLRGIIASIVDVTSVYDIEFYSNFPDVARFRTSPITIGELVNLNNTPPQLNAI